jgi:hypothetical protein
MKKKIFIGIGILLLAFAAYIGYSLLFPKSPKTSASYNEGDLSIMVTYSQPSKRGRLIFGEEASGALQPYGKYWRLGANAPTEITFNKSVTFAGSPISAGTYRMYAVPGAESFQISLNSGVGSSFGASEPDHALDVLNVNIPVTSLSAVTEKFVITFNKEESTINMDVTWDQVLLQVPIAVQ